MIKTTIVLPNGAEIGYGQSAAIKNHTLTRTVNNGEELTIGSAPASLLEVSIFNPGASISLTAGDEITLYKEQDGVKVKKGVYVLETPTMASANVMKIVAYDRMIKLDKDISAWMDTLTDWPYNILSFARMICSYCGANFITTSAPNADFMVYQFKRPGVTGRQVMKWLAEICARFCRANDNGDIEFGWYEFSGITINPTGDRYYFQNGLSFEQYSVSPVEAVQIQLANSENGALWPTAEEGANSYIIQDNAIINTRITEDLLPYLDTIQAELKNAVYTPCKVSIPACLDIETGQSILILDKNGSPCYCWVMKKTTTGAKDTLESFGSFRRDSAKAVNSQTRTPTQAANDVFSGLTQEQIFNKLTNNGEIQGIFVQDGKWIINAELAQIINLKAENVDTENLTVDAAMITGKITADQIDATNLEVSAANVTGKITADQIDATNLKVKAANIEGTLTVEQIDAEAVSVQAANIKGQLTADQIDATDLKVSAANITGQLTAGQINATGLTAVDVNITGSITATGGKIGTWNVGTKIVYDGTAEAYNGMALYSDAFYEDGVQTVVTLTAEKLFVERREEAGDITFTASWHKIAVAANS